VFVGVLVAVFVGVAVGGTGVFVGVLVAVFVGVAVGGTGVFVGVLVAVLVGVGVGVLLGGSSPAKVGKCASPCIAIVLAMMVPFTAFTDVTSALGARIAPPWNSP